MQVVTYIYLIKLYTIIFITCLYHGKIHEMISSDKNDIIFLANSN